MSMSSPLHLPEHRDGTESKKIEEEKEANLRSVINSMVNYNKIRVFNVDIEELGRYKNGGPLIDLDSKQVEEFRRNITIGTQEDVTEIVDPKGNKKIAERHE